MSLWNASPYIKARGFCPNPIVKHGIPKFADSRLNRKVIGTLDWQKFWEEQLYYIINGYETGGMHLPGRYYYYMNYRVFNTVIGPIRPQIADLHLELAYIIEHCKREGKNFVGPKGRRVGISEAAGTMIVDYGYRFIPGYKAGIAAGLKDYVTDFMQKWGDANAMIVPEFKIKTLINNEDEVIAGYKIKDEDGNTIEDGSKNIIYMRTMFNNAHLFKGLYLNDIVAEEMGEFKNSKEFFSASEDCLKFGDVQKGSMWLYGTGNKMGGASKEFQEIYHEAETTYNAVRFFIPRSQFFFPYYGGASENGEIKEVVPNLLHLQPHERIGMVDTKAAEEAIMLKRKALREAGDMKKYFEFLQNSPITIKEVFTKSSSNNFNPEILSNQGFDILSQSKRYAKYKLDWVKNENGERTFPLQVEATPASDESKNEECVLILHDGHPPKGFRNLFVAGLDSYDQDQSKTSKSLGAMVVRRRAIADNSMQSKQPVCLIRCRPPRKEEFYDMCAKVAVYYGLYRNVLIDVAKPGVIMHFKTLGLESYLAPRPKKFESANSTQGHDYGASLNGYSRPMMVSLLQSYFLDYTNTIWFEDIIDEAQNYDEYEADSDNDTIDALGLSLMQEVSDNTSPINQDDKEIENAYKYPAHVLDANGDIVSEEDREDERDVYEGDVNLSRMHRDENF